MTTYCNECGEPMDWDAETSTTYHVSLTSPTGIDHDMDEDHVAFSLDHYYYED